MGWARVLKISLWVMEAALVVLMLVSLLKMIAGYVSKMDDLGNTLHGYINRSRTLSDSIDHEFQVMNNCAEQVKTFAKGYTIFYKTMAESRNAVNHALCVNRLAAVPADLKLSKILVPVQMDSVIALSGLKAPADRTRGPCADVKEQPKRGEVWTAEAVPSVISDVSVASSLDGMPDRFCDEKRFNGSSQNEAMSNRDSRLTHTL